MRRSPEQQDRGYAKAATRLAINYAFRMLTGMADALAVGMAGLGYR